LHPLFGEAGLTSAVYTQTTDVEIEVNGLLTYDRALVKGDKAQIIAANRRLFSPPPPPPVVRTIVPTSREERREWKYTTTRPADRWMAVDFDDSQWQTGPGGFGTRNTPGAAVGTVWNTSDIWLRRTFDLPADFRPDGFHFLIHHDEDVEVFINGEAVHRATGFISGYEEVEMTAAARRLLKPGRNMIAVHCRQTTGGQFIDVGIVDVVFEN
jgi:hypothetical protein